MRRSHSIDWPIRALPWIVAAFLILTACGTPQSSVTIRNVVDTTAQPSQAPGTGAGAGAAAATAEAATVAPAGASPASAAGGPTPTDFVAAWLLFGSPTPTTVRGSARPATGAAAGAATSDAAQATTPPPQPSTTPTGAPASASTAAAAMPPMTMTMSMPMGTPAPAGAAPAGNSAGGAALPGDPAKGKIVFNTAGCTACHDIANGVTIVGPSLKGVGSRAGTRKPGMAAADYLRESILKPNAFIVPGFQPGIMLQNFGQMLSPQQLNDLIAYLMTQK